MWPWWVRIPTDGFTDVTLASEDTDDHDNHNDDYGDHVDLASWSLHLDFYLLYVNTQIQTILQGNQLMMTIKSESEHEKMKSENGN